MTGKYNNFIGLPGVFEVSFIPKEGDSRAARHPTPHQQREKLGGRNERTTLAHRVDHRERVTPSHVVADTTANLNNNINIHFYKKSSFRNTLISNNLQPEVVCLLKLYLNITIAHLTLNKYHLLSVKYVHTFIVNVQRKQRIKSVECAVSKALVK